MVFKKRSQISTEYLVLISFVVFLILGGLSVAFFYTGNISDSVKFNQINSFSEKLASLAESVYYSGEPSTTTMAGYIPEGIEGIDVVGNEIVFNVATRSGLARIAYSSNVVLNGNISASSGLKKIKLTAYENYVGIVEG